MFSVVLQGTIRVWIQNSVSSQITKNGYSILCLLVCLNHVVILEWQHLQCLGTLGLSCWMAFSPVHYLVGGFVFVAM
ncbi:hypothetical protein FB192DRAFT_1378451 [Mucor lusitanicus]|uniref:Uncharacterized protein n=1 Tax=Mucor circinelloides f. lusitanicus TaxID=29924 RepID=A0A8H4BHT6_MUCCL|nr:hypothetical protein FB192DRAFT_1378451 [Mucor lusitanicus]